MFINKSLTTKQFITTKKRYFEIISFLSIDTKYTKEKYYKIIKINE